MNIKYPPDCKAIIDVTKPPYNVDNTGKIDCTETLIKILDDVLRPNIEGLERAKQKLLAMEDPNGKISFEIRKENDVLFVIFPEELEPTKIIYFPNGIYLVSDTVTYSLENLSNIYNGLPKYEMNRQIHFKGESRDGVVIKLKDNCKGFGYGTHKPVVSFMQAESSNLSMTNTFEDITIDIGCGNSGAVGLVFFGNNTGAVRNVVIKSSDIEHKGYAGLEVTHEIVSGCYVKNVTIDGFDYGVRCTPTRNFAVFEHINIRNQRKTGFYIDNTIISIRDLKSDNFVTGLRVMGQQAHMVLIDSEFKGGNPLDAAVNCELGSCFIRNVNTEGYENIVIYALENVYTNKYIEEYVSDKTYSMFPCKVKSLSLEIKETPDGEWSNNRNDWACVDDFGAKGDGKTDDTEAIQKAMNSGKKFVFFQPEKYLINGTITIPENVLRVSFMFCDFIAGERLKNSKNTGTFRVEGDSGDVLIMEDVFTWEKYHGFMHFIDHAGKRPLVLSDLHTQTGAMYFNSQEGGEVYIENSGCTLGGDPYRDIPAYAFKGQKVWARHINPERSFCEILNDNSMLWLMGFKTENYGTAFKTVNGGFTEVLGGTISIGQNKDLPAVMNDNSTVSVEASTNGYSMNDIFPIAVEETQNGVTKQLTHDLFPIRLLRCYKIPLYVGRNEWHNDKKSL